MATQFSDIEERAIYRFADYKFLRYDADMRDYILDKYLVSAATDFQPVCKTDLSYNPDARSFAETLDSECQEILALGLSFYWLSAKTLDSELFKVGLSTHDYNISSPANALKEIQALRTSLRDEFRRKMRRYSHLHGAIATLKV